MGAVSASEIINDPTPRPKLRGFMEQATAEGSEPLDLNRMKNTIIDL